jgi:16S rRNA (guanine(1405)-N(7))-methyltransferase
MTKNYSIPDKSIDDLIIKISNSRKYRELGVPAETIRDLIDQALKIDPNLDTAEKTVRQKMHNLIAPYLGDPDYAKYQERLMELPDNPEQTDINPLCTEILNSHVSTRERIPLLDEFFKTIFAVTGTPDTILDLACGLNPFSIPWMGLSPATRNFAYDLHQPRVELISAFMKKIHQPGLAVHADILVNAPQIQADVAYFFKEAHRFDQRQHGCNRHFFEILQVKYLLVSLPMVSLTGRHSKLDQDRRLIDQAISGKNWPVSELIVGNEIIFCIKKA